MVLSEDQLRDLLNAPSETLGVELKRWIDPTIDDGIAKIAKGCIALRNNNGGLLVIGLKDNGEPDEQNAPADVLATFHIDVIQRIVGQFSSEQFSVEVQFGERDGKLYPVISVPSGVRTPVAAKRNCNSAGKQLIKDHSVYVRSLSSNNTVSSSEARRSDWERLVQICFDNREADIGAFVRRHLSR
jgi:predicted HTH transcriptional regulator